MSGADLQNRVAAALRDDSTSSVALAGLLGRVDEAMQSASREQRQAHQDALDPLADPKSISTAWQRSERLTQNLARLDAAANALRRAMAEARERESEERRAANYAAAVAERDQVGAELRGEYPKLASALVALLSRLDASNAAVAACNRDLPAGAGHVLNAEVLARGVDPNMRLGVNAVADLCAAVKLPELEGDLAAAGATAWPPSRGVAARKAA